MSRPEPNETAPAPSTKEPRHNVTGGAEFGEQLPHRRQGHAHLMPEVTEFR